MFFYTLLLVPQNSLWTPAHGRSGLWFQWPGDPLPWAFKGQIIAMRNYISFSSSCLDFKVDQTIRWLTWNHYNYEYQNPWNFGKLFYFMQTVYTEMVKHFYILQDSAEWHRNWIHRLIGWSLLCKTFEPLIYVFIYIETLLYRSSQ